MAKREIWELHQMQALPLSLKARLTQQRLREWVNAYGEDGVYVSFSGGKDSTVLMTIAREMYPSIKGVFFDTGLEFPEIRDFVRTWSNVDWVKPKMTFRQVIDKYGYPMISKEVSECVYGARKYLTAVLKQESLDRQTDRQTDRRIPYAYFFEKLCGSGSYEKRFTGGCDNKYRRVRGIGPYYDERKNTLCGGYVEAAGNGTGGKPGEGHRQSTDTAPDGNKPSGRKSDDGDYP